MRVPMTWLAEHVDLAPCAERAIGEIIGAWLPLVFAMNSLNRSMGQNDLYPFVLSPPVIAKLGFIHDLVQSCTRKQAVLY